MANGKIIQALSGFYDVETNEGVFRCRGRGVFRNQKITPVVGDYVTFDKTNENEGYLIDIAKRRNLLMRPPISNIDQAIIICSATEPRFDSLLLDRFLIAVEEKGVKPIIFVTKMDLLTEDEKQSIYDYKQEYEKIGYTFVCISAIDKEEVEKLKPYFSNVISVITGQSGVGKSTILNTLDSSLKLKTDAISNALNRGKHTTRHVELLDVCDGKIADTPGFSAIDLPNISSQEIGRYFPEIYRLSHLCKFRSCLHLNEPKCAVKENVDRLEIAAFRYKHYQQFCKEIQSRKPRY